MVQYYCITHYFRIFYFAGWFPVRQTTETRQATKTRSLPVQQRLFVHHPLIPYSSKFPIENPLWKLSLSKSRPEGVSNEFTQEEFCDRCRSEEGSGEVCETQEEGSVRRVLKGCDIVSRKGSTNKTSK